MQNINKSNRTGTGCKLEIFDSDFIRKESQEPQFLTSSNMHGQQKSKPHHPTQPSYVTIPKADLFVEMLLLITC